jgi:outer membrane protein
MIRNPRFFLILVTLALLATAANAQQTRVGYIDVSKILKRMPEVKDAQSRLDQLSSSWQKDASEMQSDIDRKQADFDRRKLIMTDAERASSELDIGNLRKKHDDFIHQKFDENGGELFTQEAAFMKPAYEKLTNAIKEAAQDGNYDYVLDRSSKDVVMLYSNTKYDLTIVVARKLGIESEVLTTSLVPKNDQKPGTPGTPTNKPATTTTGPTQPAPPPTNMTPGQGIMPGTTPPLTLTPGSPTQNPPPAPPPTPPTTPPH